MFFFTVALLNVMVVETCGMVRKNDSEYIKMTEHRKILKHSILCSTLTVLLLLL